MTRSTSSIRTIVLWGLGTCHGQLRIFSAALAFTVNTASKLFKVAGEATIPNA
jgi:hypothetical protein